MDGEDFRRDLRAQAVRAQDRLPLVDTWSWEEAGPGGITDVDAVGTFWQGADNIGGLVMDIAIHQSPDEISIATILGGVWRTPVGGNGWLPQTDDLDALGTAKLAVHRGADGTEVLYAASGSPNDERSSQIQSFGIARSLDGGASWQILDGGITASRFVDRDVNGMIAFDANRLLVATDQGLFYSADGGRNFGSAPDYRDGQPVVAGRITDLQSGTIGGNEVFWYAKARDGVYRGRMPPDAVVREHDPRSIEDADNVGLILFDRVVAAGQPTWLVGTVRHDDADHYHSLQYKSPGQGWRKLLPGGASPPYNGVEVGQTDYNHVLAIDPDTPTRGFLGLVSMFRIPVPAAAPPAAWSVTELSKRKIHADQHAAAWDTATTPSRLYVGNDGGIYRTENGGTDWVNLNRTLRVNLVYGMDVARRGAGWEILIGMQDTGTARGVAAAASPSVANWTWTNEGGGDGGEVALQPEGGLRGIMFENEGVLLGTRSAVGDDFSWNPAQRGTADFSNDEFRFSGTVAWARDSSGDWDEVYVGFSTEERKGRLYKSTDAGSTFAHLRPTVGGAQVDDLAADITVLRTGSSDPASEGDAAPPAWSHVWVGLVNGQVGRSTDGGATFTFVSPGPSLPVTTLAIDPTDADRVAVGYSGFTGLVAGTKTGHVWLTEDGGRTWNDIGGAQVPDLPVFSLVFSRTNPVGLFLGNDAGVLVTTGPSFGEQWRRVGLGLPRVRANALRVVDPPRTDPAPVLDDQHPPDLFVGTHGRSVFRLTRPADGRLITPEGISFGTAVGASPVDRTLTLRNAGGATVRVHGLSVSAPFSIQGGGSTPFDIPAGGSHDVTLRLAAGAAGISYRHLSVVFDPADPIAGTSMIALSGERVASGHPRLGVDPILVGIPRGTLEGDLIDVPLRLTNGGETDLSITEIVRTGSSDFSVVDSDGSDLGFPLVIGAGATRTVALRLESDDDTGHQASFEIRSNDPAGARTLEAERPGPAGGFPTWATVLIVIGAVAAAVAVGVGAYLIYDHYKEGEEPPVQPVGGG
jgi:hypothetical protein